MKWDRLLLFVSGIFFGGAIDHAILGAMGSEMTPYGIHSGVAGNWFLAGFDLAVAAGLFVWHRRLARRGHAVQGI